MILVIFLFLLIATSQACVLEIRSAIFHPNGTQEITRDWLVVDFENSYNYDLFDVDIGEVAYLSVVKTGEKVKIDPYRILPPKEFPIFVISDVRTFGDRSEIEYRITNLGNSTEIEISIPKFSGLIYCENCEISSESIIFRKNLAKNETASFKLITSREISVPDGKISFSYEEFFALNFTANFPVSVVKSKSDRWIGIFNLKNTMDREMDVVAIAFADFQNGSRVELFNEKFKLGVGETFSKSVELQSSEVPIFLFKVGARVSDFCKLRILPAYEINGRYIVGQALLKGISYIPPIAISEGEFPAPIIPAPPAPSPVTPTPTATLTPTEIIERYKIEFTVPFVRIPKELVLPYFVAMFPSLFGIFIVTVFFPVRSRRGIVATKEHENAARIFSPKFRIYCPPSSQLSFGIVVEPDEDLVSAIIATGIPREHAEAIAVAVKVKKPLITNRKDVARIALKFGIPVMLYGKS